MKQYRISLQVDIFVQAESEQEARETWIRNTHIKISNNEGNDHDWEIGDCEIVCI